MRLIDANGGVCAMASTDYCESKEDCYLCGHGKKMREKLADYEEAEQFSRVLADTDTTGKVKEDAECKG